MSSGVFTVTALGHQGWLIGNGRTHVLVDPILRPRFSRLSLTAATIYPPRRLDLRGFPPIDAVLVSHEHPDHLDFASLQLIAPQTPVYMSAHTSRAAKNVVASVGLEVRDLAPGVAVRVGDLSVLPFAPPSIAEPGSNEIDVVPLLIRDCDGHGSFFTSVDLAAQRDLMDAVRDYLDRPGVWADANSGYDRSLLDASVTRMEDVIRVAAERFARRYVDLFAGWGHPELVMITENGLTLGGDLAPLNAHAFEVPNDAMVALARELLPGHELRAAAPGTTAVLADGEVVAVHASLPHLAPEERTQWPPHGGEPLDDARRRAFSPGTGRPTLNDAERTHLGQALGELARFLFARPTFRGLYRLMAGRDHDASLRSTAALVLRDGDATHVWEYSPTDASFVQAPAGATASSYVAGVEMWAADLLAVLTLEACATDMFHFGRKLSWNAAPGALRFDLDTEIELFAHALRQPAAAEALYRRALTADARPVLAGPGPDLGSRSAPNAPNRAPKVRPVPEWLAPEGATPSDAASSAEAAPDCPPVDPARASRFMEAVQGATRGAWSVARVADADDVVRLELEVPGGQALHLEMGPMVAMSPHYKLVGDLAFRYGPGSIDEPTRHMLDRVIAAVVVAIGPGL
jgi:L-ascorbate metabolism protein UlaG (beta-lactamase superfamily)